MADIGVVAIGRNEGERLVACLASLAPLGLPIVYVDSASTDGSREAARAAGATVVELDLARPFTAARARNEGAAALTAAHPDVAYIQFVDGDCSVAPGWINTARAFLDAEPGYVVACGRRRERHPEASRYNRLFDQEWDTPIGDADSCGGDALMRARSFATVGGFDEHMVAGEEPELCSRFRAAGWKIRRLDAEMTMHDAAMYRFGQWWRRSLRGGFGYAQAWRATRMRERPLFARQLQRALAWGLVLPLSVPVLALVAWHLALVPIIVFGLQLTRLAMRAGLSFAWLITTAKFAEAAGAVRFFLGGNRRRTLIEYK